MNSNTKFEIVEYQGWSNCVRLSNEQVDVIITTQVGPRVIRFGFVNQPNEFKEYSETLGKTGDEEWNIYGGHRLWHAPENNPRTYSPDNSSVEFHEIENGAHFIQSVEETTGIQKEIEIRLSPDSAKVEVLHRLINRNLWNIELAPWALSVMNVGGTAIIPLPPRGTHPENLLPTSSLILWPFTDMSDPRWNWGQKYILLHQDESRSTPQKVGVHVRDGWSAYANNNHLFVKTFEYAEGATYPDRDSVVETFTNEGMLELETLGPTVSLAPYATVEHKETWHLFDGVSTPANDADVKANVLPLVQKLISKD